MSTDSGDVSSGHPKSIKSFYQKRDSHNFKNEDSASPSLRKYSSRHSRRNSVERKSSKSQGNSELKRSKTKGWLGIFK